MVRSRVGERGAVTVPPPYRRRCAKRTLCVLVELPLADAAPLSYSVQADTMARCIFDSVCQQLQLAERDYFGLQYTDTSGLKLWLDLNRPLNGQCSLTPFASTGHSSQCSGTLVLQAPPTAAPPPPAVGGANTPARRAGSAGPCACLSLCLAVKFYTPSVEQLQLPLTRQLFLGQLLRDLDDSWSTGAASAAGVGVGGGGGGGDRSAGHNSVCCTACKQLRLHLDRLVSVNAASNPTYVSSVTHGVAAPSPAAATSLMCFTNTLPLRPLSLPAAAAAAAVGAAGDAEQLQQLLATAARCERYGVKPHQVTDERDVSVQLAVLHYGLLTLELDHYLVNRLEWPLIRKLSFKRRRLLVKLHPLPARAGANQELAACRRAVLQFQFGSRNLCKHFWKLCVEHHGFFARTATQPPSQQQQQQQQQRLRSKISILSRGSSFRYTGRTQQQLTQCMTMSLAGHSDKSQPPLQFRSLQWPQLPHTLPPAVPHTLPHTAAAGVGVGVGVGGSVVDSFTRPFIFGNYSAYQMPRRVTLESGQMTQPLTESGKGGATCERPGETLVAAATPDGAVTDRPVSIAAHNYVNTDLAASSWRHVLRQLLHTERTFRRDLQLVLQFVDVLESEASCRGNAYVTALCGMLGHFRDIDRQHAAFLTQLELGNDTSDSIELEQLLLQLNTSCYELHVPQLLQLVELHDGVFHSLPAYRRLCESFESQLRCYLPLIQLMTKPTLRLLCLQSTLSDASRLGCCASAVSELTRSVSQLTRHHICAQLPAVCNRLKLHELHCDLAGLQWHPPPPPGPPPPPPPLQAHSAVPTDRFSELEPKSRQFLLEGCLQEITHKGSHTRMVFLLSDVLLVCAWLAAPLHQFSVERHVWLSGASLLPVTTQLGMPHHFALHYRCSTGETDSYNQLVLAANCDRQYGVWLGCVQSALAAASHSNSNSDSDSDNSCLASVPAQYTNQYYELMSKTTMNIDSAVGVLVDTAQPTETPTAIVTTDTATTTNNNSNINNTCPLQKDSIGEVNNNNNNINNNRNHTSANATGAAAVGGGGVVGAGGVGVSIDNAEYMASCGDQQRHLVCDAAGGATDTDTATDAAADAAADAAVSTTATTITTAAAVTAGDGAAAAAADAATTITTAAAADGATAAAVTAAGSSSEQTSATGDMWRNNRSSHVCWRRGLLHGGRPALQRPLVAQCSGWLRRKFTHADGWQRLWVTLAAACLFFFRSHEDEAPLTCLPLLGYSVATADDVLLSDSEADDAAGGAAAGGAAAGGGVVSHVLSLSYRQHRYLFAAYSEHAQRLWLHQLTQAADPSC